MLLRSTAFSVTHSRSSQQRRADSRHYGMTPHRRDEPSKTKDIHTSDLFSESSTCTCTFWVVAFCSRPDVGSRANDALSVSQILAYNFENVMVTYASIFTGPRPKFRRHHVNKGWAWFEASTRTNRGFRRSGTSIVDCCWLSRPNVEAWTFVWITQRKNSMFARLSGRYQSRLYTISHSFRDDLTKIFVSRLTLAQIRQSTWPSMESSGPRFSIAKQEAYRSNSYVIIAI